MGARLHEKKGGCILGAGREFAGMSHEGFWGLMVMFPIMTGVLGSGCECLLGPIDGILRACAFHCM